MIVLGAQPDSWATTLRSRFLSLGERASRQIGELNLLPASKGTYQLLLLDGGQIQITPAPERFSMELTGTDAAIFLHILDETIALDDEDREQVSIDAHWLDMMVERWIGIAADYTPVDVSSNKTAQLASFDDAARKQILEIYRYAADHMHRSGHTQQLDIHLTLPTDYWSANLVCTDAQERRFMIAEDPVFSEMLEALPEACEIIAREGQGMPIEITPLYLTPVRIG